MFSALLSPKFMSSFEKIIGADFEICRHSRMHPPRPTHGRTEAILQLPGSKTGDQSQVNI